MPSCPAVSSLRAGLAALALLLAACGGGGSSPEPAPEPPPACLVVGSWEVTGLLAPASTSAPLAEVSGLATSELNPGILWAHDDAAVPTLYALEGSGTLRATLGFSATLYDVEDIARGPGPVAGQSCLYVADTGDNARARSFVRIVRLAEPVVPAGTGHQLQATADVFVLAYPDGAHDVESLVVDPEDGTLYLLEKDPSGGDVFRVPLPLDASWTESTPGMLVKVTTGRPLPADLTAADAGPDGKRIFLRSYFSGYQLLRAQGASFVSMFTVTPCPVSVPGFGQYESLAVSPAGDALWTTSELRLEIGPTVPIQRAPLSAP